MIDLKDKQGRKIIINGVYKKGETIYKIIKKDDKYFAKEIEIDDKNNVERKLIPVKEIHKDLICLCAYDSKNKKIIINKKIIMVDESMDFYYLIKNEVS